MARPVATKGSMSVNPNRAARLAVGVSVPRVDGVEKVTGAARYTGDTIPLGPALWAKTLRSPFAHARIRRIDTTRAAALRGVHSVLTGADVAGRRAGRRIKDMPILAEDVVRFIGDPVAVAAADDEETAERALALIDVDYEQLPAVFDPLEAMRPDAILLHPDIASYVGLPHALDGPSNVFVTNEWAKGDVEVGPQQDTPLSNVKVFHPPYLSPFQHPSRGMAVS